MLELGPGDLSLTRAEAALLLAAAQVALGDDDVASCTSGPRDGRPDCTWLRWPCERAARWAARRSVRWR